MSDFVKKEDAIRICKMCASAKYRVPYIEQAFDNAPSIDIVRCQDCKHWRNTDAEKIPTASIACGNMHADDFCSYGERRE